MTSRFVIEWTSPEKQHFEMYGPGPDGDEVTMMEMTYTRR